MNRIHRWICGSDRWQSKLETEILPWALDGVDLGERVLEIGPGPGLTCEILSRRIAGITAVELDTRLARRAHERLKGTTARIVCADGTKLPLKSAAFSGAVCFTMLHHVPSPALQDRLLAEAARVLRPGGVFAGVDSLSSFTMKVLHLWDTLVPIDPATFERRLEAAGFTRPVMAVNGTRVRFAAYKP